LDRIWLKFIQTGSVADRRRPGRPKVFSNREERSIVKEFLRTPGLSIKKMSKDRQAAGKPGSRRSLRRVLGGRGLVPKVSERGKEITKKNN